MQMSRIQISLIITNYLHGENFTFEDYYNVAVAVDQEIIIRFKCYNHVKNCALLLDFKTMIIAFIIP